MRLDTLFSPHEPFLTDALKAAYARRIDRVENVRGDVARCVVTERYLFVVLADGRWGMFVANSGYDGCDPDVEFQGRYPEINCLRDAGIITDAEAKAEYDAIDVQHQQRERDAERAQYEKLRAKFDPPKPPP